MMDLDANLVIDILLERLKDVERELAFTKALVVSGRAHPEETQRDDPEV